MFMRHRLRALIRRFRYTETGTAAIEFAIVSVIFFTLVFGMVIYGSYFASALAITHIAQDAARASLAGLDDSERSTLAVDRANELIAGYSGLLKTQAISVTAGPSATPGIFTVEVTYQNDFLGLAGLTAFVPLPPTTETATISVSNGGY
jgi:Flp pilus assembly protein TadG